MLSFFVVCYILELNQPTKTIPPEAATEFDRSNAPLSIRSNTGARECRILATDVLRPLFISSLQELSFLPSSLKSSQVK